MKTILPVLISIIAVSISFGDVHYVAISGGNVAPYTNWTTAAINIQAAIDEASSGDIILVSNGTYSGAINVTKSVTVQSVNGPSTTTILGHVELNNFFGLTCWFEGFTVRGGTDSYGGGIDASWSATVRGCIITGNSASQWGGGIRCYFGGIVENCLIFSNSASLRGGGVYFDSGGTIRNCVITRNTSSRGGGLAVIGGGTVINSIIYNNTASTDGANYYHYSYPVYLFSCTTPAVTNGEGNIDQNPLLGGQYYRVASNSPCIDVGTNLSLITSDFFGTPRPLDGNNDAVARHDIGAHEYVHPLADSDADGVLDVNELNAGSNPTDSLSFLHITAVERTVEMPLGDIISWQSSTGRQYAIEAMPLADSFESASVVASNITSAGTLTTFTNLVTELDESTVYRIIVNK